MTKNITYGGNRVSVKPLQQKIAEKVVIRRLFILDVRNERILTDWKIERETSFFLLITYFLTMLEMVVDHIVSATTKDTRCFCSHAAQRRVFIICARINRGWH
ncbi:hypothetical protein CW304_02105 [Bacillus sp. UFRGS-B20]|nr:hypothetical protein CW304_02105 [Bacillus sp. UFRGS-B20]